MRIDDILSQTEHRPWKLPTENWKFYQEWNNAIFLHWQVELAELKKFVPKELEIDLFKGKPWISLVAFTMEKIRPKNLPSFPPISDFDEINIRTYAKFNNKTGVYFLSIEGGKLASCKIAKGISELPYRFSKIKRQNGIYKSINKEFNDQLDVEFELGKSQTEKTEVGKWLTERYALFQDTKDSINEFDIHHLEWPTQKIELKKLKVDYSRFKNLITNKPNLTHYSKGVQVIAWNKNKNWLQQRL